LQPAFPPGLVYQFNGRRACGPGIKIAAAGAPSATRIAGASSRMKKILPEKFPDDGEVNAAGAVAP
jgi:hypothetical protein